MSNITAEVLSPEQTENPESFLANSRTDSFNQPSQCQYPSYLQFVEELAAANPEYEWLLTFLRQPGTPKGLTEVTIFDSIDNLLKERGTFSTATEEFANVLESPSTEVNLRLIIMTYLTSWIVDRSIVDKLGLYFDIDPDFIRRHFYFYFSYASSEVDSVPSEKRYMEDTIQHARYEYDRNKDIEAHVAMTRSYEKLSAYVCNDPKTGGLLIFIRSSRDNMTGNRRLSKRLRSSVYKSPEELKPAVNEHLASRYLDSVRQMSSLEVAVGNTDLLYFLHPYIRDLIYCYNSEFPEEFHPASESNFLAWRGSDKEESVAGYSDKLRETRYQLGTLLSLRNEVGTISSRFETGDARITYHQLMDQIASLIQKFEDAVGFMEASRTAKLMIEQAKEAHNSTTAALSVNRLSKLAFLFIPLSFTTSFFGMNVVEFGQGTVPIKTFFITTIVIGICTLIPIRSSLWRKLKDSNFSLNSRLILKLGYHHPSAAFWYIGLCMFFEFAVVLALCGEDLAQAYELSELIKGDNIRASVARDKMDDSLYPSFFVKFWKRRAALLSLLGEMIQKEKRGRFEGVAEEDAKASASP